jgi:citrate synthase
MQPNSQFAAAYSKGINKLNYWEPVLEDSIDIIAKLPAVAALIYRNTYKGGDVIESDSKLDWAANLSHMMGEHHNLPCTLQSSCCYDVLHV